MSGVSTDGVSALNNKVSELRSHFVTLKNDHKKQHAIEAALKNEKKTLEPVVLKHETLVTKSA